MLIQNEIITAEDLFKMPDGGQRRELVRGTIHNRPHAGSRQGYVTAKLALNVLEHVISRDIGTLLPSGIGCKLFSDPDTVRVATLTFVANPRAREISRLENFIPFAPELVFEIIARNKDEAYVYNKVPDWLQAGTKAVVVIDLRKKNAVVLRPDGQRESIECEDVLSVPEILPAWWLSLRELFR